MVTVWYECDKCEIAYPFIDEARKCERRHKDKVPESKSLGDILYPPIFSLPPKKLNHKPL